MKTKLKTLNAVLLAVLAVFAFSCRMEDDSANISEGMAKVNVFLVDAPADYDAVWVEVLAVEILPKGENENNGSAWINLANEASDDNMINLLELTGGNSAHLGEIEVPAGEISQIRLILGDNNYLVQGDRQIDLKTPSAQQSGLKLKVDKPLQAGIAYDIVIDFDAGRSIVRAGNSGQYILKPVLRVVAEESATIEGAVLPLEAGPVNVAAIIGEDTVSTFTSDNGSFMIRGLRAGNYSLFVVPNEEYQELLVEDVETTLGQVTNVGTIELELVPEDDGDGNGDD
ncbi:DUF4382 domain-containing protein [Belliella pelovolcani]|uniref:DUF4382 domain-containing protein n=1 Tax=Belliella pelovolcani TaxID=529505 RepID=A0A1N7JQP9_9BACT|nr:DUF4382 domain-containing protein [Belliella pelovolcani]SIS51556.1 protein of unknown function [Belliella pelovolcani]